MGVAVVGCIGFITQLLIMAVTNNRQLESGVFIDAKKAKIF